MSNHEEKTIGTMSLDEMLAASHAHARAGMPIAGGDADTKRGWARRLGLSREQATKLIRWMEEQGHAKEVRGQQHSGGRLVSINLIHCPELAKRCK